MEKKTSGRRQRPVPRLADEDDILPERLVGEEPLNERALRDETNPRVINPERRGDSYNVDPGAETQDPYGEDLTGIPPLEDEPSASDILPDQVKAMPGAEEEDEEAETARPKEEHRPIKPEDLPD